MITTKGPADSMIHESEESFNGNKISEEIDKAKW
jgi:hypothetical protein